MSTSQGQAVAAPTTWTEPPWCGWIETTGDALLILEAARRGLIPRVTRRLVDSERKMITSGSVFVFDEDESGIKRWTDGFFWSPSRILGNFLLYRETDKKSSGRSRGVDVTEIGDESNSLSKPKDGSQAGTEKLRERNLMGSLTNNYKFKSDGLMKKTFSLTIGGVAQHLISYYRVEDVENGRLRSPSSLPELASLSISPEYLDKTHFRNPPKVEVGPDGVPRYRGEADDVEIGTRAPVLSTPLSGLPLLTEGRVTESGKRSKRYEPYGGPAPKRQRKQKSITQGEQEGSVSPVGSTSTTEQLASPTQSTSPTVQSPPPQTYQDPNSTAVQPVPVYAQYNPCFPPTLHPYPYHHPANPPSSPASVTGQQQQLSTPPSTTATYPVTSAVVTYHYDPNPGSSQQQQQQPHQYSYYHPPPTGAYPYPIWHPAYGGYNHHHQAAATPHQHPGVHAHVQGEVDGSSDGKVVDGTTSGGVEG
ncbi:camp-independent regulatory protein [Moniliophthora roreri]|uniref:Camp independent regulatory protein n=1 Tax=Moniliophthora roreri TaxID=221103 RepID=A0A0W0F5X3_MONRR|nr:camp-independent regulatory protein [Moniliophthora roreri]